MTKYLVQFHITATANSEEEALEKAEQFIADSSIVGYSMVEFENVDDIVDYLSEDIEGNPIVNNADQYDRMI